MSTTQTTIYGASDDLIEFDGAINGETGVWGIDVNNVILTAPNGEELELTVEYCTDINPNGWGIRVETHGQQAPWPIAFGTSSSNYGENPAITITHPQGTTATCNGEKVQ